MQELKGTAVKLLEGEMLRRERENKKYLMSLENNYLLRSFRHEAGRFSDREHDVNALNGWEDLSCQLRGHFLGHWLSSAAFHFQETGDGELKAKAEAILEELELCQIDNGGEWACSIPEKYLYWIGQGRNIWAPQYTIHKLFMGLVDVYRLMKVERALAIADRLADWFYRWSGEYSKDKFDDILDVETGGMLEIWADLLEITGDEKYKTLLSRYYRGRLFDPLLEGKDVLTNMHANTTIPEIMGCARAYEVTGDEKWLEIVKSYWKCAVTDRGYFVTGGQTQGEIWTPKMKLKARLGDKNQEHCTVYNMIRVAEFLFRQTKDPAYMHYIEYNVFNGIFAQTYGANGGLLTYFLPMKAASKKDWAGKRDTFFCCHGTMVQANASWNRRIYYQDGKQLYVTSYVNSEVEFEVDNQPVRLIQRQDMLNGSMMTCSENNTKQTVNDIASAYANRPDFRKYDFVTEVKEATTFTLLLRVPDWIKEKACVYVNDELVEKTDITDKFVTIDRVWENGDKVVITLPIGLTFIPLPDDEQTGAFRYGPDVLAGVTDKERILKLESANPEDELSADTERQWGDFRTFYRTENQDPGISFMKLNDIYEEPYQIYFKVRK